MIQVSDKDKVPYYRQLGHLYLLAEDYQNGKEEKKKEKKKKKKRRGVWLGTGSGRVEQR